MKKKEKTFQTELDKSRFRPHDVNKPLYKFTSAKTAKLILENRTLRFTVPSHFNDPFELHEGYIDFTISGAELREFVFNCCWNQTLKCLELKQ